MEKEQNDIQSIPRKFEAARCKEMGQFKAPRHKRWKTDMLPADFELLDNTKQLLWHGVTLLRSCTHPYVTEESFSSRNINPNTVNSGPHNFENRMQVFQPPLFLIRDTSYDREAYPQGQPETCPYPSLGALPSRV